MNKKFSTLMVMALLGAGALSSSAFAANPVKINGISTNAEMLKDPASGKTWASGPYFVVVDMDDNQIATVGDFLLTVTESANGELTYKGTTLSSNTTIADLKTVSWYFNEEVEKDVVSGAPKGYLYSLKNLGTEAFLTADKDGNIISDPEKCSHDATKNQYTKFSIEDNGKRTKQFTQGSPLYLSLRNISLGLGFGASEFTTVTGATVSPDNWHIILCNFDEKTSDAELVAELNDVKGGAGFNLEFSVDNKYEWANDILSDLNLKAFYVASPINIDNTKNLSIPAGVYFASEYPASLNETEVISNKEDFYACTFVAVDPDKNYNIHQAATNGIGFELTTVAGSDMNFYQLDDDSDDASVKGEIFVGNACFDVTEPDPLGAPGEYNFKLAKMRHLKDLTKTEHVTTSDLCIGYVADQNKNYLITNTEALAFTTTNSTLYDVTKLLKSEDAPSIYTMQFVSDLYKDGSINFAGEKEQYLTVGNFSNQFALAAVQEMNAKDPMFQFVITAVDKENKTVTFKNRQTQWPVTVSLYENEDGSFTVYSNSYVNISKFDDEVNEGVESNNGKVTFVREALKNTKVVLTPVEVEDKYATFVNRAEGAGLVTFELAKNADDAPEFYVGAKEDKNNPENLAGDLMAYADEMTQFELIKSERRDSVLNNYVYLKDTRVLNSTQKDTVAFYTYKIKAFTGNEEKPYYIAWGSSNFALKQLDEDNVSVLSFVIKENVDGSVSLIDFDRTKSGKLLTTPSVDYVSVKTNLNVNTPYAAWTTGDNYDLYSKLSEGLKTFMVEENPAISYEAVPQHVSFEAVRGGFLTKDENSDARLAIATAASEDLTFWLDTVHSDYTIPSFYVMKNGAFMYNATDSAVYYNNHGNYRFNLENKKYTSNVTAKLIFKAGELVTSDTIRTTVNSQSVLVAEKDNAPKNIKGGLKNFQFQIIRAEEGSDEYVIRQGNNYVCQYNNYFYMSADKSEAYRFVIEKQAAPTANEGIEVSEVKVIAGNGQVTIMGAAGKKVVVSNILGKVVASQTISSDNATIAVPAGIVAVAVEGEAAVKAVVK